MSARLNAADFFVLRTPALPADSLAGLREAFEVNRSILDSPAVRSESVREAIFLASENLYRKLYSSDVGALDAAEAEKLSLAVAKYVFRMARRCTPFGAFAGVATGDIAEETRLNLTMPSAWARVARLDQAIVAKAQARLFGSVDGLAATDLDMELNASAWRAHDGYRYVEAVRGGSWTHYELSRIAASPAIDAVFDLLRSGPMNGAELARQVEASLGADAGQADAFVRDLAANQLIEAKPRLAVTGDDVVGDFVERLLALKANHPVIDALARAQAALGPRDGTEDRLAGYEAAIEYLRAAEDGVDASKAIQVDMHASGDGLSLSRTFVDSVLDTLTALAPLLARPHTELSTFAAEFEKRYGDATVPLLEVLDDDLGIPYGGASKLRTPLVDGLALGGPAPQGRQVEFRDIDAFLLGRVQTAAAKAETWIEISDKDLEKFKGRPVRLPDSAGLLGSIEARPDGDPLFHFSGAFGPPAGVLLGRFACGSPDLTDRLRRFADQYETEGDAIVAEFTHLPDGRVGNVILRPVLRRFEIPYLASSGAGDDNQIPVSDLEVFCREGRVHLWSRKLGRTVVPRMSNAHNNNNPLTLPVYRFFGALQRQGQAFFGWQWGSILDSLPVLPGVRYRNVTLVRPRWRLYPYETADLVASGPAGLEALLRDRGMPNRLRVRQADNFLELDLTCALDRALFLQEARRNRSLECEAWTEGAPVVTAGGEGHLNEVAIPVYSGPRAATTGMMPTRAGERARHAPGEDWLYARIFCGPSVADQWIAQAFEPWAAAGRQLGCDRTFFIRYLENGPHLRVRMQGVPGVLWGPVREKLEASLSALLAVGAVSRLEYATYFPEVRRYGGPGSLEACEAVFAEDSLVVSAILSRLPRGPSREEERWRWGFRSLFHLVRACSLDPEQELRLLTRYREGYAAEFGLGQDRRAGLNAVYRKHKAFFEQVASGTPMVDDDLFAARSEVIAQGVQARRLEVGETSNVLDSLLHMAANRLFPERARAHELVIFHAMVKAMESVVARRRFAQPLAAQIDA